MASPCPNCDNCGGRGVKGGNAIPVALMCDLSVAQAAESLSLLSYRRRYSGITAPVTLASLNQGGDLVSFSVQVIASNTDSVTFTDSGGTTSGMRAGEVVGYSASEATGTLDDTNISVELTDGSDVVSISWQERA